MRRKRNIFDMFTWRFFVPGKCCYCEKDAVGTLVAQTFYGRGERNLCRDCYQKWLKGELYI